MYRIREMVPAQGHLFAGMYACEAEGRWDERREEGGPHPPVI